MSIRALQNPVAIGASPVTVDLNPIIGEGGEVKIANESPNPIIVRTGVDEHVVPATMADVFCLKGAKQFTATPLALPNLDPISQTNAALLVSVADRAGEHPGTYPAALVRQTSTPMTEIGVMTAATINVAVTGTFKVPAGTHSIGILVQQLNDWSGGPAVNVTVQGTQSGAFYVNQGLNLPAGLSIIQIASARDKQVTITLYPGTVRTPAQQAFIYAIFDPEAVQVYGGFGFTLPLNVNQGQGSGPFGNAAKAFYWNTADSSDPYDGISTNAPAAGSDSTQVIAAITGRRIVLALFRASLVQSGATAGVATATVQDGASVVYNELEGTDGTLGHSDHAGFEKGGVIGTTNTAMTARAQAPSATIYARSTAGWYVP